MESSAKTHRLSKRKRRPQSPSSGGIFTRSKTQIYVHRNLSGRAYRDITPKPDHPAKKYRVMENPNVDIPIKDLRARRVFSTGPAIHDNGSPVEDFRARKVSSAVLTSLGPNSGSFGDVHGKDLCKELKKLETFGKANVGSSKNVDLCGSDEGNGVMVDENTENVNGLCKKLQAVENEKEAVGNGLSNSSSKMIVNLYKRPKVFKAPSSFSYRRLLPYLKDMAKYESEIQKVEIVKDGITDKFKSPKCGDCDLGVNTATFNVEKAVEDSFSGKCENASERCDGERPQMGEKHKVEAQAPTKLQDEDALNNVVKNVVSAILAERGTNNGKQKDDENGVDGGNELMGDSVPTTPPDAVGFSRLEQDISGGDAEGTFESNSTLGQIGTNETFNRNKSDGSSNTKSGAVSKAGQVLIPCSRLKVFKPLGSVSYRRLLPYLTSVDGANSCVSATKDPLKKAKKDFERGQDPAVLTASVKESTLEEMKLETSPEKKWTVNEEQYQTLPMVPHGSADKRSPGLSGKQLGSKNDSSDVKPSSITSSNVTDSASIINLRTEATPQPDSVDNANVFEEKLISSAVPSCQSANHENSPMISTLEMSLHRSDADDKDCTGLDDVQLISRVKQSSSNDKEADENGSHVDGLRRGILKRNPRGCRGLCSCLNCALFRLNAERAFEFSRNQMQDAEEVARELIKELRGLCHMLESSAATVNEQSAIQLNQLHVEAACRKASETEKLMKERLGQMNEDLKIHCRTRSLERPRVAFSIHIDEEKVVPSTSR